MQAIQFHGFVSPREIVRRSSGGPINYHSSGVDGVVFHFKIKDSVVWIGCESTNIDDVAFNLLHLVSYYMVRGVLDAIGFTHALPMTLILDACTKSNGKRVKLRIEEPQLAVICTVPHKEIIALSVGERAILKHLHTLSEALTDTLESEANCHKAVEGFAQLLLPGGKPIPRWKKMQENLNIDEDYLKFITDLSKGPRHGTSDAQSLGYIAETRRRAWVVANRFLEFRKRGNVNLSAPDFPLLRHQ